GTADGGVDVDSTPKTMTISVTSVPDAPVGTAATVTAAEDTAYNFKQNDFGVAFSDPNDNPADTLASVIITTLPDSSSGTLTFGGQTVLAGKEIAINQIGQLTYQSAPNANGNALSTFTFQLRDSANITAGGQNLDQTPRTMTVNVTPVNDPPTGAN